MGRSAVSVILALSVLGACSSRERPAALDVEGCHESSCLSQAGAEGVGAGGQTSTASQGGGSAVCEPDLTAGVSSTGEVRIAAAVDLTVGEAITKGTVNVAYPAETCGFVDTLFDPTATEPTWQLSGMAIGDNYLRFTPQGVAPAVYSLLVPASTDGPMDAEGLVALPRQSVIDAIYAAAGVERESKGATVLGRVANMDDIASDAYISSPKGSVVYQTTRGWDRDQFLSDSGYFAVINVAAEVRPGSLLAVEALQISATDGEPINDKYSVIVEEDSVTWMSVSLTHL